MATKEEYLNLLYRYVGLHCIYISVMASILFIIFQFTSLTEYLNYVFVAFIFSGLNTLLIFGSLIYIIKHEAY
jgi:hypothetical protein